MTDSVHSGKNPDAAVDTGVVWAQETYALVASSLGVHEIQFSTRVINNKWAKTAKKPSIAFSTFFAERQESMKYNS